MNEYKAAEGYAIGMAADLILGEKSIDAIDTVVGDPDTMHRPQSFAEFDE
jgi:hypothetical protein